MSLRLRLVACVVVALPALLAGCAIQKPGLARGKEVYRTCVPCHGENAGGNVMFHAPDIGGLPQWYVEAELTKFRNGIRGAHPEDVTGQQMAAMSSTLEDTTAMLNVVAFIRTLGR